MFVSRLDVIGKSINLESSFSCMLSWPYWGVYRHSNKPVSVSSCQWNCSGWW